MRRCESCFKGTAVHGVSFVFFSNDRSLLLLYCASQAPPAFLSWVCIRAGLVIGHTGHFPGGPTHLMGREFYLFFFFCQGPSRTDSEQPVAHWFVSCIDCINHPITTRYRRNDEVFCSAYIKIASPLPTSPLRELRLKMDRPKRKGGAEKLREKRIKSLEADAAKCAKITDMFTAAVASTLTAVPKYVQQQEPEQVPSHDCPLAGTRRRRRRRKRG